MVGAMDFPGFGHYEKIASDFERLSDSLQTEGKPELADRLVQLADQIRKDCEPPQERRHRR
jgi:hypothetical protein